MVIIVAGRVAWGHLAKDFMVIIAVGSTSFHSEQRS